MSQSLRLSDKTCNEEVGDDFPFGFCTRTASKVQFAPTWCKPTLLSRAAKGSSGKSQRLNPSGGGVVVPIVTLRFSTFDRMFTTLGRKLEGFTDRLPAVSDYLTRQGYNYVDFADVDTPYDGKGTCGTEHWTWVTRFFDYL